MNEIGGARSSKRVFKNGKTDAQCSVMTVGETLFSLAPSVRTNPLDRVLEADISASRALIWANTG
jgi:hypothetical protein